MKIMSSILQQFMQRKASPLIQFIKYGISGGVATVVHIICFFLCAWLVLPALNADNFMATFFHIQVPALDDALRARNAYWDNWLAFIFSNFSAYVLNIVWVFEPGRHHRVIEIGMFYAVSAISIFIGGAFMWALIRYMSFSTTVAFGAELIAAALINFAVRKYVIFKG